MKKTPLQRKTPLKAHTRLQVYTPLKAKQKTAKKITNKEYWSIFSKDLSICVITGDKGAVPHHIFGEQIKYFPKNMDLSYCSDRIGIQYQITQYIKIENLTLNIKGSASSII